MKPWLKKCWCIPPKEDAGFVAAMEAVPVPCSCALFMAFEPLAGKRWVQVRARRTAVDFAQVVKELVEETYHAADKGVLVLDNLNTHGPHSLYEAFEPVVAKRLCDRLEWHFTPRQGSWP